MASEKDTSYQAQRRLYWTLVSMIMEYRRPRTHEEMRKKIAKLHRTVKAERPDLLVPEEDYPDEVRRRLRELAISVGADVPEDVDPNDDSWMDR